MKTGPRLSALTPEPPEPPAASGIVEIEGQVAAPELYVAWSLPRGYDDSEYLAFLALGSVREAINNAARRDNDVVGGTAFVSRGEQASMLVARIVLRDGEHAQASADKVLGGLYRACDQREDESPRLADFYASRRAWRAWSRRRWWRRRTSARAARSARGSRTSQAISRCTAPAAGALHGVARAARRVRSSLT